MSNSPSWSRAFTRRAERRVFPDMIHILTHMRRPPSDPGGSARRVNARDQLGELLISQFLMPSTATALRPFFSMRENTRDSKSCCLSSTTRAPARIATTVAPPRTRPPATTTELSDYPVELVNKPQGLLVVGRPRCRVEGIAQPCSGHYAEFRIGTMQVIPDRRGER